MAALRCSVADDEPREPSFVGYGQSHPYCCSAFPLHKLVQVVDSRRAIFSSEFVSDIAIFVLKRHVKLQLTNCSSEW